jgi:hypothetical protein
MQMPTLSPRGSFLALGHLAAIAWIAIAGLGSSCGGGEYSTSTQRFGHSERGETNGRMFDYVAMTPEGDQWEVRLRGTSMWVAYSLEDKLESFKPVNLATAESDKVWKLVEAIDLPSRRRGKIDEINGTVMLRLREPGDEDHDLYTVYFSREAENQKVGALAKQLISLIKKYHQEKAPL